jgi:hypothetical protein
MEVREQLVQGLPHSLRDALKEYMRGFGIVDVLYIDVVYDLRLLNITWAQLGDRLLCLFTHNVTFTRVRSTDPERSNRRLEELLADPAVVQRCLGRSTQKT